MKVNFTNEIVFSFDGPNLCLLGNENDFRRLSESILELMDSRRSHSLSIFDLDYIESDGEDKRILFSSKKGAKNLGTFNNNGNLIFELDSRYWERVFKYFVLMYWYKRTYYLNVDEECLDDLDLEQECNFICSSEF